MNPLAKLFNDLITRGFEYFGRYYSSYRGFVVDNNDPEKFGRIKVKVPQVYGSQTMDYWAWQKNAYSGDGYGIQCIPNKGDMIYVEFELGDPKKPIWSYGHFGRTTEGQKEKPSELEDIQNYWFKTPGGNLVEFDDKNELIRITAVDGKIILMKDNVINLGSDEAAEPAILGDKACDLLKELIDAINALTVSTSMGPSGTPINSAQFTAIKNKVDQLKSEVVKLD